VSTGLLVSTGAVSCYPASMVSLIWFANDKCLSCQHWATCDPKTQPSYKLSFLVHCLARMCEIPTISTDT